MKLLLALRTGESSTPAIDRALALGERSAVEVTLFTCVYDEYIAGTRMGEGADMQQSRQALIDNQHKVLQGVAVRLREKCAEVDCRVSWNKDAAQAINSAAVDLAADMILLSTSSRSSITRLFLTNTDWQVVRDAQMPVLLASPKEQTYEKTLVAVDPTHTHDEPAELDRELIAAAQQVSSAWHGEVLLGHVYPSVAYLIHRNYVPSAQEVHRLQEMHKASVYNLAQEEGFSRDQVHFAEGAPKWQISQLARQLDVGLVVMGSISRSFIDRLLIGSTTESVLQDLECDVLLCPASTKLR